ncbi:MAG: GAF domain-containing protein [Anaerolineae bacterium]|nr:GAF domain-containing protein [Anaerolineae bacterium]
MRRYRLSPLHWPINTKLVAVFLLASFLPAVIVLVPFEGYRRNVVIQEQNEVRLEILGPLEIVQTQQVFDTLITQLERLYSGSTYYALLEAYLVTASEADRTAVEEQTARFFDFAPSLSRVRFYDAHYLSLLDVNAEGRTPGNATPADALIKLGELSARVTLSEIYVGPGDRPLLDAIFAFRPGDTDLAGVPAGYMVFTQDLSLAAQDDWLPDLYGALQTFPRSKEATHVFVLDSLGGLVAASEDAALFTSAVSSDGFREAQQGYTGVSRYYSPLLDTQVLGYHEMVSFPDGPVFTYLVETPVSELTSRVWQDIVLVFLLVSAGGVILGSIAVWIGNNLISRPVTRLTENAQQIAAGRFNVKLPTVTRRDEIGRLNNTLSDLAEQLISAITDLEERVAVRTRNLETTLEIGRVLTGIHDMDTLLEQIVTVIRDQFDTIYHAQVFLIDPATQRANLRASTGAVGRRLLQRGHYLEVGSQSVIGSVTASGHAVVALDTSANPLHRHNEFLPDTRAEMALPLRTGKRVIGALDLQSTLPDAFGEPDVDLFQGMADQVTIAIENATLFAESNARLQEIERLNQSLTRMGWREIGRGSKRPSLSASVGASVDNGTWSDLQQKTIQTGQVAVQNEGQQTRFAVPVVLRGEVLGAVEWQVPSARYSKEIVQLAHELTTRLALTAENIRLSDRSRQAAQREYLVSQISTQLVGMTDVDEILKVAVRELGLALRAPQTAIQLVAPPDTTDDAVSE